MSMICIYHANCTDGFAAAWVVYRTFEDVEFFPASYGENPPDVTGKNVIIVDFSYKRPVLMEMAAKAETILIIDHHKSAQEDLIDLPANVTAIFDMNHSGAVLTWMSLQKTMSYPWLLRHIEDRDLWRFRLAGTREIHALLTSYPFSFELWNNFMGDSRQKLADRGEDILRKQRKDIADIIKETRRRMIIDGVEVNVVNIPPMWSSDAGHILGAGEPFAATYYDSKDSRVFSLRSAENGYDVSAIAKKYGGGGHKHAAGFKMPLGWEGDAK